MRRNVDFKNGRKNKIKSINYPFAICALILMVVFALTIIVPMVWAFFSSFKSELDYSFYPLKFPLSEYGGWRFDNFSIAYKIMYIAVDTVEGGTRYVYATEMFMNSLIYSAGCTFVCLFSHIMMAYICARFKSGFGKMIYGIVVVVLTLPIIGNLPAELQMSKTLGIYDSLIGIWVMKGGFFSLYFLVFYAALKAIPRDYSEAAEIDGAGPVAIMIRIILPMIKGAITTVALLVFIGYWNEYYTPMVYLPTHPTIAYGLYRLEWNYIKWNTTPRRLAASFIVALPLLALAVVFRKKLVGTISIGGIKG